MAHPPTRQPIAVQASQRDRDCHRKPPGGGPAKEGGLTMPIWHFVKLNNGVSREAKKVLQKKRQEIMNKQKQNKYHKMKQIGIISEKY